METSDTIDLLPRNVRRVYNSLSVAYKGADVVAQTAALPLGVVRDALQELLRYGLAKGINMRCGQCGGVTSMWRKVER